MDISAEEEIMDINQLKVVLIGQSSVGKTALINQYINKLFIDTSITTIGTDKFSKIEEINNTEIKINIWDTAGQERFRSLSHLFLKGANIVLMVYDITNQDSFNELKQFWIERVNDNTKNIILGIIANKSDLYENEVVSINDGKKFANECNGFFFEVSAKNYDNTRQMFIFAINKYLDSYGFEKNNNDNQNDKIDLKDKKLKKRNCC